jgi:polar amino acid transport system permease protein
VQEPIRAIPVRHPLRWVAAGFIVVAVAWLLVSMARVIDLGTVRRFLFNDLILDGLRTTIIISVLAQLVGIVLGVALAVMRLSRNPVTSATATAYVWFFRGTPVLVQLLFWYAAIPQAFPEIIGEPSAQLLTSFRVALLGLGLNEAAYMAEIVRAGILSVDEGQLEAAHALGMPPPTTMRRIVLPQAMRVIIPPTGNEFISMLKTSSLASVVLLGELLRRSRDIFTSNLETLELLVVASIWYLVLTTVASFGQSRLERRFSRGRARAER